MQFAVKEAAFSAGGGGGGAGEDGD